MGSSSFRFPSGLSSTLRKFKRRGPELLHQDSAATADSVTSLLNRDLQLWSDGVTNFSTDDARLRMPTHPATVDDIPMLPPLPCFVNIAFILSTDGSVLRLRHSLITSPEHIPFLSGSGATGRLSPKRGAKHGGPSPSDVKRKATTKIRRAWMAGNCRWPNRQFEHLPRDEAGAPPPGTAGDTNAAAAQSQKLAPATKSGFPGIT